MTGPTPEQARALWAAAKAVAVPAGARLTTHGCAIRAAIVVTDQHTERGIMTTWRAASCSITAATARTAREHADDMGLMETVTTILNALGPWSPAALAAVRETTDGNG